jgi:Flp pilus assembly protein TadG
MTERSAAADDARSRWKLEARSWSWKLNMRTRLRKNERGAALIEASITIPIILLIAVGIFEFGRAYQTWQVLTNAAREGARVAILSDKTEAEVTSAVRTYMQAGGLPGYATAGVVIDRNVALGTNTGSKITVNYPFSFIVLNGVAKLVAKGSTAGKPLTMQSVAIMRNEI